jgi:hypothetical protein
MDLINILSKKISTEDVLDPGRKALLCQGLTQLSRDGACSAFMIIKAFKENIDKSRSLGDNLTPYYGTQAESKFDSTCTDITFEINELPNQLLLLLEQLLKEK